VLEVLWCELVFVARHSNLSTFELGVKIGYSGSYVLQTIELLIIYLLVYELEEA